MRNQETHLVVGDKVSFSMKEDIIAQRRTFLSNRLASVGNECPDWPTKAHNSTVQMDVQAKTWDPVQRCTETGNRIDSDQFGSIVAQGVLQPSASVSPLSGAQCSIHYTTINQLDILPNYGAIRRQTVNRMPRPSQTQTICLNKCAVHFYTPLHGSCRVFRIIPISVPVL